MLTYDKQCYVSRQEYHKAKHKNNTLKTETSYNDMISKSKKYKQEIKRVQTKEKQDFISKLRNTKTKDSRLYWQILQQTKKKSDIPILVTEFKEHFKRLAETDHTNEQLEINVNIHANAPLNKEVTEAEVLKCISKLKNNKASGVDNIINEYIKSTKEIICPLYVKLFNKVMDTGDIPDDWLTGIIVPIFKNVGEVTDVNNYRGITLLSCMGKLFTTLLNERLADFCEENEIIKEIQAGFRQGYSTVDHVFVIKSLIDLFLHRRKKLFCLYIDYRKAFDLVWRDGLWYKLLKEGVDGKIMRVIKNMYNNIKSCVLCNQEYSDYFVSYSGVRRRKFITNAIFFVCK